MIRDIGGDLAAWGKGIWFYEMDEMQISHLLSERYIDFNFMFPYHLSLFPFKKTHAPSRFPPP